MFRLPFSRRVERDAAARIYAAALAAARRPALYLDYGVPDTLQGRFEMVALHLFVVLHRLMHEPGDGPELARMVSERFVDDMDGAFREMGVGDLSVPKRMQKLYSSFAGRITAYKRAIADERGALAEAISRNVFPDGAEARHAEALAEYFDAAVRAIRSAELTEIRAGEFAYPPLPQDAGRAGDT